MSTQMSRCSLQQIPQSWFSSHPARKAALSGSATALLHLSAHIYLIKPCAWVVFLFWKKIWAYGQGRMQSCSISSLSCEKWKIRDSGCTGTAMCLSVYPSGAIPGICTISETFLFPVCGGVGTHSASSLDS